MPPQTSNGAILLACRILEHATEPIALKSLFPCKFVNWLDGGGRKY